MINKKNKGFTLIELIVVIVILAILVGVTIGGISVWVQRARLSTDYKNADSIERAVGRVSMNSELTNYIAKENIHANLFIQWRKEIDWNNLVWDPTAEYTSNGETKYGRYRLNGDKWLFGATHKQLRYKAADGTYMYRKGCRDMTNDEMNQIIDIIKVQFPDGLPAPSTGANFTLNIDTNPDTGEIRATCEAHKLVDGEENWYNDEDANVTDGDVTY